MELKEVESTAKGSEDCLGLAHQKASQSRKLVSWKTTHQRPLRMNNKYKIRI